MEARELRIGNIVSYKGFEGVIEGIRSVQVDIRIPGAPTTEDHPYRFVVLAFVSAVPLTAEWVDKFNAGALMFDGTGISIYDNNGAWTVGIDCDDSYYNKDITPVQYVHQLQNLYYALTGKELELK